MISGIHKHEDNAELYWNRVLHLQFLSRLKLHCISEGGVKTCPSKHQKEYLCTSDPINLLAHTSYVHPLFILYHPQLLLSDFSKMLVLWWFPLAFSIISRLLSSCDGYDIYYHNYLWVLALHKLTLFLYVNMLSYSELFFCA